MENAQDLAPSLRRRFQTGRMCLDFTHTGGTGAYARWELLHEPADAARFLGIVIGTDPPLVTSGDMSGLCELRTAIDDIARATVAGIAPPTGPYTSVNERASRTPLVPQLLAGNDLAYLPGGANQAASTLARDAIDLFASPLVGRIRVCDADDCGLLFVDTSRPGRRRWCSMQWCGDRAKKRAAGRAVSGADT